MDTRWPLRIAFVLLFAAGLAHVLAYRAYQPDDAFIFLVYAKNLLAGQGLSFNGEVVEGYSSLLWCLLVAAAGATGADLLATAKLLGSVLYLLVLPGIGIALVRRLAPDRTPWSAVAVAALMFTLPPVALWSAGALETLLHATLVTLACWAWFEASVDDPRPAKGAVAGIVFGLLAWTRPEGFAFLAAVPALELLKLVSRRAPALRAMAACLAVALAMVLALLAWRRLHYEAWLPVTVSAKTGDLSAQLHAGGAYLRAFIGDHAALAVAYAASTAWLLSRRGRLATFAAFVLVFVTGQTVFALVAGGDWMPGYRFLVPCMPLACVVVVLALAPSPRATAVVVAVLAAFGLHAGAALHTLAMNQARDGTGAVAMGRYIASLPLPAGSAIAVVDAGAIPFYAGVRTIDMVGLNNAHIARLPGGFLAKWDNAYVLSHRPQVVQLHTWPGGDDWWPLDDFQGTVLLFYSDEFQRWYDRDVNSPIAHLFRRRAEPKAGSYMAAFTRADLTARYDAAAGRLDVEVRKTGPGAWPVPTQPRLQNGTVMLRARWLSAEGTAVADHYHALPRALREGEAAQVQWALPTMKGRRLQVCLVLLSVIDFPACALLPAS